MTTSESLTYSTVRIECVYKNGSSGTGTGFFFAFPSREDEGKHAPILITNKHVIKDAVTGRIFFTGQNAEGLPSDEIHLPLNILDFEKCWYQHPEADVDLCALSLAWIVNHLNSAGTPAFFITMLPENMVDNDNIDYLDAVEDVLMVGYPIGLWDSVNNKPLVRRGITATHPAKDYLGKKQFVIDAACFPGSSGSPVYLYNGSGYTSKDGKEIYGGRRMLFLGILYAGPQTTITGDIVVVDIPTVQTAQSLSKTMINLGYVIKAEKVLDFKKFFSGV